jgi:AraC-like DNA-binding protein
MTRSPTKRITSAQTSGLISRLAYARGMQAGIDVDKLLKRSGLAISDINDQSARISVQKQIKFVELVAEEIGDANFGFHLAQEFDLREIGFLYYIAASADTLGEALRRAERYSVTANESVILAIRRQKLLHVYFQYRGVARHTDIHQIEFWITAFIRAIRHLTNRKIHPYRVRLAHHKNDKKNEFRNFVGGKIETDSDVDAVDLAASTWNLRILNADPYLHRLLIQLWEEARVRRRLVDSSFKVKVENAVAELLPHGDAKAKMVAEKLRVSSRTMARRLSSEHLTFTKLLRELRSTLSRYYLADPDLHISQIAWLLGYKEVSTFTHAFRRWTGKSPSEARIQRQRYRPART